MHIWYGLFFYFSLQMHRCAVITRPVTNAVKYFSMFHPYIFFVKVSVQIFCSFFNWVICFLIVALLKFFIYSYMYTYNTYIWFTNIFSPLQYWSVFKFWFPAPTGLLLIIFQNPQVVDFYFGGDLEFLVVISGKEAIKN